MQKYRGIRKRFLGIFVDADDADAGDVGDAGDGHGEAGVVIVVTVAIVEYLKSLKYIQAPDGQAIPHLRARESRHLVN